MFLFPGCLLFSFDEKKSRSGKKSFIQFNLGGEIPLNSSKICQFSKKSSRKDRLMDKDILNSDSKVWTLICTLYLCENIYISLASLIWQFVSKIGDINWLWKLHGHLPKLKWQLKAEVELAFLLIVFLIFSLLGIVSNFLEFFPVIH